MLGDQNRVRVEPIACPFDLDDNGVVQEPIEERGGDDGVTKDLTPFCVASIGGQE